MMWCDVAFGGGDGRERIVRCKNVVRFDDDDDDGDGCDVVKGVMKE